MSGERALAGVAPAAGSPSSGRVAFAARVAVALGLIGLAVHQLGGPGALRSGLGGLSLAGVALALLANTADRLLMTWKWALLLRARGHRLSVLAGTQIYCAAMVWGMFLPATMGSDAVRALSTVRRGLPPGDVLASIVVERALGLLASLAVGLLALLVVGLAGGVPPQLAAVGWGAALLLAGGALALVLSFSDRAFDWIHERLLGRWSEHGVVSRLRGLHESYRSFGAAPRTLWNFGWLSALEQLGPALAIWILAVDLGVEVSPVYLAAAVTLSFLVARVPISLGGLGVMEGSLVLLLSLQGVPGREALALAVAGRIVEVASWLPWWLSFSLGRGSLRRPRAPEQPA